MKTFEKLMESRYIETIEELDNEMHNNTQTEFVVEAKTEMSKLQKLERIILLGEMRFKSLLNQDIILDYADPTKLEYTMSDGSIHVFDGEYEFDVCADDAANTVVFARSGYKCPAIAFLLREFKSLGLTLFNDPDCVNVTNNKYLTALMLSKHGLPQPKFVLISKSDIHKGDHSALDKKLKTIYSKGDENSKYVCKILGGHGGQGVFLCTGDNVTSVLQAIFAIKEDIQILVQECEDIKDGDIRAHVLTLNGKQELLNVSMRTKGSKDFRTNLSLGNSMKAYELNEQQKAIVFAAAKASGLTWCGVDLLPLENGENVILELNGAPGPPSEISGGEELQKENEQFYKKFIDTVNTLCSE